MHPTRLGRPLAALALVGLLGVTACSTSSTPTAPKGATAITVATDSAERLQPVVDAFNKAHPDISVSIVASGSGSYDDFLRTRLATGNAPDVLRTFPGAGSVSGVINLSKSNDLIDLSDQSWVSSLSATQKLLFASSAGKVVAVPMGATGLGPVYNNQALAAIGASIPKTWTDVMNLCATAKAHGKVAYTLFQKGGSVLTSFAFAAPLVYGPNPQFTTQQTQGSATFATSAWTQVFQKQLDMEKAGCFNASPNGTDLTASTTAIATGNALGIVFFSDTSSLAASAPAGTTFTLASMPVSDDPSTDYLAVADAYGFGINPKSKNIAAAKTFIAYLATADAQNPFANALGGAPSIANSSFVAKDPNQAVVVGYESQKKTAGWADQSWPTPKVDQALLDGIQQLYDGKITPAALAATMDDAFKSAGS